MMEEPQELEVLKRQVRELDKSFRLFLASTFTADGFLRYEKMPMLIGDESELAAGTSTLEITLDRFYVQELAMDSIQVDQDESVTILDVTETGRLIAITLVCITSTASAGSGNVKFIITIDGGTPADFQMVTSARVFDMIYEPFITRTAAAAGASSGDSVGDAIVIPFGITYMTSLKVELVASGGAGWVGEWDLKGAVHRATKTA